MSQSGGGSNFGTSRLFRHMPNGPRLMAVSALVRRNSLEDFQPWINVQHASRVPHNSIFELQSEASPEAKPIALISKRRRRHLGSQNFLVMGSIRSTEIRRFSGITTGRSRVRVESLR